MQLPHMPTALLSNLYSSYFQERPAIPTCTVSVTRQGLPKDLIEKAEELHLDLYPSVWEAQF